MTSMAALKSYENDRWQVLAISDFGEVLFLTRNYKASLAQFDTALSCAKKSKNLFGMAYCTYRIGTIKHLQKDFVGAQKEYQDALELKIQSVQFCLHIKTGLILLQQGDDNAAKESVNRGIGICTEILKKSKNYLDVKLQLALGYLVLGNQQEAAKLYDELYHLCSKKLDKLDFMEKQENPEGKPKFQLQGAVDTILSDLRLMKLLPKEIEIPWKSVGKFNDLLTDSVGQEVV